MAEISVQGYRVRLERTGQDEFLLSMGRRVVFKTFWKRYSLSRGVVRSLVVLLRKGEGELSAGDITIRASRLGTTTLLSIPERGAIHLTPDEVAGLIDMVEQTLKEE